MFLSAAFIIAAVFSGCDKTPEDPIVVDPDKVAYDNASVEIGGKMYNEFWLSETGYDQSNPNIATLDASADFFRCKACHGWDGLGSKGSYINRGPKTTRPAVSDLGLYELAQTKTSKELFDAMKATNGRRDISYDLSTYDPATNNTEGNKMPNYNQLLTDAQIWDIVKFMKAGMFDVSKLYDATYTGTYPNGSFSFSNVGLDGDATKGNAYYAANCEVCHGADGTTIDLGGKTVGKFGRKKANEAQHKVKYGQLGSPMTGFPAITLSEMKDLYVALSDTTNFPD